jgi:hypothetical protein
MENFKKKTIKLFGFCGLVKIKEFDMWNIMQVFLSEPILHVYWCIFMASIRPESSRTFYQ